MIARHHYYADGIALVALVTLLLLILYSAFSNPYGRISRVKSPYQTKRKGRVIELKKVFDLEVKRSWFWRWFAYMKCAWHIISNVRAGSKARGRVLGAVIRDVHRLRFDPRKPYLISGDHFNVYYPRNLGVFYYAMLDPRTALGKSDWENRQRIYLQTVAYALDAFRANGEASTTIVPVGPTSVSCINIYHYPSDALYGILFALDSLEDNTLFQKRYPFESENGFRLETKDAARKLIEEHRDSLGHLLTRYYQKVFNEEEGLVRTDIHISSAKDITMRESAFYDNVIFWKTFVLARTLDIDGVPDIDLSALKARILKTYWQEKEGYFLEDRSSVGIEGKYYSADWLCAYFTGFLDVAKPEERVYLERAVSYTIKEGIDMPFPLRYQQTDRAERQFPLVRIFLPSYGGTSIWSFWGAEFIKLLSALSHYDSSGELLERAGRHVDAYEKNIVRCKGYPEVYATDGKMLRTPFYNSVRQTGWVVGFEQAVALFKSAKEKHEARVTVEVSSPESVAQISSGTLTTMTEADAV